MPRERSHIVLAETGLVKRTAHANLAPCFATGPEICGVVRVETVNDPLEATLACGVRQRAVYMFFAKVTTIDRIGGIPRIFDFIRLDLYVRQPNLGHRLDGHSLFLVSKTRRHRDCRQHLLRAQYVESYFRH